MFMRKFMKVAAIRAELGLDAGLPLAAAVAAANEAAGLPGRGTLAEQVATARDKVNWQSVAKC